MAWGSNLFPLLIITSSGHFTGLFVYSPAPGPDKLIASIAATSGTDPFGNNYLAGFTTYGVFSGAFFAVQLTQGGIQWYIGGTHESVPYVQTVTISEAALVPGGSFTGVMVRAGASFAIADPGIGGQFREVWLAPSGDTTGVTDAANINAAFGLISGPSNNPVVHLLGGTFYVNATIQIPSFAALYGPSPLWGAPAEIFQVNAANLDAVIASSGWTASTNTSAQNPITIQYVQINGNSAGQTGGQGHGIVSQNFDAYIERNVVLNTRGDGIRFDKFGANGTTAITNTMGENRINYNQCRGLGGRGICTNDTPTGTPAILDGFCEENLIQSPTGNAIEIQASAGWRITGNHTYGTPTNGIIFGRPTGTRVTENYIENYGSSATLGTYQGIGVGSNFAADGGIGSVISHNIIFINAAPGNAGTTLQGIGWATNSGANGTPVMVGNQLFCGPAAGFAAADAIVIFNQNNTSTTNSATTGNLITGNWTIGLDLIASGGVLNHSAGV